MTDSRDDDTRTSRPEDPEGVPQPAVAVAETHAATVFFLGDRAYKAKKPVTFPFLDFSTRERREAACRREVELNRRLAPDVYLGVATVLGTDGEPCEHLVVMRRMPAGRRLSRLVASGAEVEGCLEAVGLTIAAFHARASTSPEIAEAGSPEALRRNWDDNVVEMMPFAGRIIPEEEIRLGGALASRYLAGRRRLIEERIAAGTVRDGHGDLLADDIFCLDDGPRILDCIDFNDRFRHGDVLLDIAFLAMDLERLGRPDLGERLLAVWQRETADTFPATLLHHFIAYRAHVRAKVACFRADQGERAAAGEARRLHGLALEHLERARVALVLVGGPPGTGKSTVARALAAERGWTVLRSDEIRKQLAGLDPSAPAPAAWRRGIYHPRHTGATYREMLSRAREMLEMGEAVILDASWSEEEFRREAAVLAEETGSDLAEIRCEVPAAVARQRLVERAGTPGEPSDAGPAVADAMAARFEPWPRARPLDTSGTPEEAGKRAAGVLAERLAACLERLGANTAPGRERP